MTFSIVARDPQTGWLGFGTASRALASAAAGKNIQLGVGVITSQAFANPYLAIDGLRLLEEGLPAERVIERVIESDRGRDFRQVGIVDREGRVAAYTGERCINWAGAVLGAGYVCLGNILAGEGVVKAMANAYERSVGEPLYERVMRAIEAGEDAGGDRRGRQSAGIRVFSDQEYPYCDLRVDDHVDPIPELRRILGMFHERKQRFPDSSPRRDDFTPNWEQLVRRREVIEEELDEKQAVQTAKES